jgi:hypothetical protein
LQRPFDGRIDGKIVKDITIAILIKNPANWTRNGHKDRIESIINQDNERHKEDRE